MIFNLIIYFCIMTIKKIHIGEEIKSIVEKKYSSYAAFGRKIGKTRQCLQTQIFSKQSLQTDLLIQISEELGVNLFELFQSDKKSVIVKDNTAFFCLNFPINITKEELTKFEIYDGLMEMLKQK